MADIPIRFNTCKNHIEKHFISAPLQELSLWENNFATVFRPVSELIKKYVEATEKEETHLYNRYLDLSKSRVKELNKSYIIKENTDAYIYSNKDTISLNTYYRDDNLLIGANYAKDEINIRTCFVCKHPKTNVVCYLVISEKILESEDNKNALKWENGNLCIENVDTSDESINEAVEAVLGEIKKKNTEDKTKIRKETLKSLLDNFVKYVSENQNSNIKDGLSQYLDNPDCNVMELCIKNRYSLADQLVICAFLSGIDSKYKKNFTRLFGKKSDYTAVISDYSDDVFGFEKDIVNKFINKLVYDE